jgi:MFS family permease
LLGAAEAGFYPGILFFLTLWFPAAYRARVLAVFIAAIPISGIIGAPVSGLLLSLNGLAGLQGWQWLYLIEAAPALLLGPVVIWRLQDNPAQAAWLPDEERRWLIDRLQSERTAVESRKKYSVVGSLTNPRLLLLAAVYFTNVCLLNSITFFLPHIVKSFGASDRQTGLIVALPSVLALVALIWWGRRSDRRQERYGHASPRSAWLPLRSRSPAPSPSRRRSGRFRAAFSPAPRPPAASARSAPSGYSVASSPPGSLV